MALMGAALVVTASPSALAEEAPSPTPAAAPQAGAQPAKRELNVVPIAGGDSDVGIGVGEIGDWARLQPGTTGLYRWRLETGAFISFKLRDDNDVIVPFQDYYLLLSQRNWGVERRWTLDIRASFTDETTLKFYGIGNASALPPAGTPLRQAEYGRVHPTFSVETRRALASKVFVLLGSVYTHNWLTVPDGGTLATTHDTGPADMRALLGSFSSHGVELLEAGIEYDSRDNEIVTHRGVFHALQVRYSPHLSSALPYSYEQIDLTSRVYTTPIPRWLTLSARAVGDVLLGSPPFYELARFNQTPAIGGVNAVRGVPAQRYYGKVKLFGNFEARSELWPFKIRGKQLILGAAAFVDAGRVWTAMDRSHPDLDGTGLGIKYGVGGGLRLQQGQTFVVRADLAWSPDARPIGAYFAAGEIF
jgi:outer membrane protein assembly factor BamA